MSFSPNPQSEIKGIENIRSAMLYLIIGSIINIPLVFLTFITDVAIIGYIILAILFFIAYIRLREGFGVLQNIGKNVGLGKIGAILLFIGGIIGIISSILLLVSAEVSLGIDTITFVFVIIGEILVGVALYDTGKAYNEGVLQAGGILVAIIITAFIGYILAYAGLGTVLNKLRSGNIVSYPTIQPYVQPSLQSSPIYQIGTGTLSSNGEAYVTIYSPSSIQIISAEIVGMGITTSLITPTLLSPGNNNIIIKFGAVNLTPNNTYTIRLTLGNGQTIDTFAAYKP